MDHRRAAVMVGMLQGRSVAEIAVGGEMDAEYVKGVMEDVEVGDAVTGIERAVVERMTAAEFAVPTMAKATAGEMLEIVAKTARRGKSDMVRYKAAMDVLGLAGHVPVKRVEALQVDRVLEQMTSEELDAFIASGTWPPRLMGRFSAPSGTQ